MAYDPNDPADKAIFDAAVDAALETDREAHAAQVTRLENKNNELLGKLNKARTGGGGDNLEEIARLERELEESGRNLSTAQGELRETGRKLKAAEVERDKFKTGAETENAFSRNLLVENALTSALVENNVAPHFMEAARALLKDKVKVELEGNERKTLADGKPVSEFVKEWAAGDAGKHYVSAPANGGGGASGPNGGGNPNTGGKKLADMSEQERIEMDRTNPAGFAALVAAEGSQTNIAVI